MEQYPENTATVLDQLKNNAHMKRQHLIVDRLSEMDIPEDSIAVAAKRVHDKYQAAGLQGDELAAKVVQDLTLDSSQSLDQLFPQISSLVDDEIDGQDVSQEIELIEKENPGIKDHISPQEMKEILKISKSYDNRFPDDLPLLDRMKQGFKDADKGKLLGIGAMATSAVLSGGTSIPAMIAVHTVKAVAPTVVSQAQNLMSKGAEMLVEHGIMTQDQLNRGKEKLDDLTQKASNNKFAKFAKIAVVAGVTIAVGATATSLATDIGLDQVQSFASDLSNSLREGADRINDNVAQWASNFAESTGHEGQGLAMSIEPDLLNSAIEQADLSQATISTDAVQSALDVNGIDADAIGSPSDTVDVAAIESALDVNGINADAIGSSVGVIDNAAIQSTVDIANSAGSTHLVQQGDTLSGIIYDRLVELDPDNPPSAADLYGENGLVEKVYEANKEAIAAMNGGDFDPNLIMPGTEIDLNVITPEQYTSIDLDGAGAVDLEQTASVDSQGYGITEAGSAQPSHVDYESLSQVEDFLNLSDVDSYGALNSTAQAPDISQFSVDSDISVAGNEVTSEDPEIELEDNNSPSMG